MLFPEGALNPIVRQFIPKETLHLPAGLGPHICFGSGRRG